MNPGWYPDPDGRDEFRWFDGQTWTQRFSTDAREAPSGVASRRSRGWRWALAALVAAGLAVIMITGWASTRPVPDAPDSAGEAPLVSPTGPSYNTTAPVFTGDPRPCPVGRPTRLARHPADGRVHGGNLSFPRVQDFRPPATERRFGFAHDVRQQGRILFSNTDLSTPGWSVQLMVGQLRRSDGFDRSARGTATRVLDCTLRSALYRSYGPVARVTANETRSLGSDADGRSGHLIAADVVLQNPPTGFPGDHVMIAVTPDGPDWSFFLSAVPLGNAEMTEQARRTLLALRTS